MIDNYKGPKTTHDTYGREIPYVGYVKALEEKVEELSRMLKARNATITNLVNSVNDCHRRESQRLRYEQDYLPYEDDSFGRD